MPSAPKRKRRHAAAGSSPKSRAAPTAKRFGQSIRSVKARAVGIATSGGLELPTAARESAVAGLADRALLEHFGVTAVLVRASGEILRFYGRLAPYLQLPSGVPKVDLLTLARDVLKPSLREALHEAVRQNRRVQRDAIDVDDHSHPSALRITVTPVSPPGAAERLWLIIFEEMAEGAQRTRGAPSRAAAGLVGRLKSALGAMRKEHQRLVEELEEGNEKLKASNEEVLTMNEELTTLNTQLEHNVAELTAANDDLANLLLSSNNSTLIVDTELRIKRFTVAAAQLLNLVPADRDRPLTHIATNLVDADLAGEARAVLAGLQAVEREVATRGGGHYFLRALPYRSGERQVQGVVMTLVDMSTLKHAERELRAAREQLAEDLGRMTRLHQLAERLALPAERQVLLEEILRAAIEITDAEMATLQECSAPDTLTISAQVGFEPPFLNFFAQVDRNGDSVCGRALSGLQRVLVEDVASSALFAASPARQVLLAAGVRAMQSTPLLDRSGHFLGMFSTHYRAPHRFEAAELRWLDLLARHASDAIEHWRAEESLRHSREDLEHRVAERTQWLTLLNEISQSINDAPTWDSALQRVLERICAMDEWRVGYVYLPDPEAPNVIAPAISCISDERFRPFHQASERQRYVRGEGLPGRVYAQGVSMYARDARELLPSMPVRAAAAREVGLQAGVAHAITAGQEVIAVLELFSDQAHPRNDWFDNLLPAVADQVRRILERERSTARMADIIWREQQDLLHTLHDALGQTLTGLGMLGAGLRQQVTAAPGEAAETAAEIARQAQHALAQVRQLSRSLFPLEVEAASLTAALRELAFATQSLHKIQVRVEGQVPETFSDGSAATQLYRIAQEAVTNAVKHAQARSIAIQVARQGSTLRLRIADDGIGIGKATVGSGIGLQIMRYRAHSIGGILIVEPGSPGGTVVTCTLRSIPMHKTAQAGDPQRARTRPAKTHTESAPD